MREVMGCIEQQKDFQPAQLNGFKTKKSSGQRRASSATRSSNHAPSSKASDPGNTDSGHRQPKASSTKKRISSYGSLLQSANGSSTASTGQAAIDEEIARYLKSPRLTTLLKLQRQPDPMIVSLADIGSPTGHPVIIFLGLGCVRYLVALYDELAEALGLRLVCIDRWGLGKTSQVPDHSRGFLEWSNVLEEVVDQLKIYRFSILAHSAGAPYALAASLKLGDRVQGSVHLLAPWVSMTADGGVNAGNYKWLKYVPNSMIKTAQAAEWKMTGWRLGKPPSLNQAPVGYNAGSSLSSKDRMGLDLSDCSSDYFPLEADEAIEEGEENEEDGFVDRERVEEEGQSKRRDEEEVDEEEDGCNRLPKNVRSRLLRQSIESRLSDWSNLSSNTSLNYQEVSTNPSVIIRGKSVHSGLSKPGSLLGKVFTGKESEQQVGRKNNHSDEYLDASNRSLRSSRSTSKLSSSNHGHESLKRFPVDLRCGDGDRSSTRSINNSPGRITSSRRRATSTLSSSRNQAVDQISLGVQTISETPRALIGISLMKASYAESLKGGTSDLMAILEKNSKPWGFSYRDVYKDLKVWHGSKDEKLSCKGSEWISEVVSKGSVKLKIVEGADHGLMTNVKVMYEVLESISEEWNP
ncbi:hypothetical protein BY996DRAFT_7114741 [Phakopsora pachyrhizi]|nr:hypothetical protein BY996DRAFT_7114741 [Phakopsora pachyrhizi]